MSQLEKDEPNFPPSSANEESTCPSPSDCNPSPTGEVALEVHFEDRWQDNQEQSSTDSVITLSFENSKKGDPESSDTDSVKTLNFENPHGSKTTFSSKMFCEKKLQIEMHRLEDDEVREAKTDLEDGEIQDIPDENSFTCRYYQKGSCAYGKDCRFLHISDKGLYSMLELPASVKNNLSSKTINSSQFVLNQNSTIDPPVLEDFETDWDRALKSALERLEPKKKTVLNRMNLRKTVAATHEKKRIPKRSSPKKSRSQTYVRSVRYGKKITCKSASGNSKLSVRERLDWRFSFLRSNTPKGMRWSPKSVSSSSQSRSRSRSFHCERPSCSCSSSPSPKRGRRIRTSRVKSSYRKYASRSSESSSTRSLSRKLSKRKRSSSKREGTFRYKSSKISDRRSPIKRSRLERKSPRLSRRDLPRRTVPRKHQVTSRSSSINTIKNRSCSDRSMSRSPPFNSKTFNRNCSDMSISPLSYTSSRKSDLPQEKFVPSDRHATDMSISPISYVSSPPRFLCRVSRNCSNPTKLKVKKMKENISKILLSNKQEFTKSNPRKNDPRDPRKNNPRDPRTINLRDQRASNPKDQRTNNPKDQRTNNPRDQRTNDSKDRSTCPTTTNNVSISREKVSKKDPLVMDLMKFCRTFNREVSSEEKHAKTTASEVDKRKNVPSKTHVKATYSELDGKLINMSRMSEVKQNTATIQSNTDKKNILLKRSLCPTNNVSNSGSGRKVKKVDPLVMDLMKFHGMSNKDESSEEEQPVPPPQTHVKATASELAGKPINLNGVNAEKQEKRARSKKDALLKQLQEIEAAIERKANELSNMENVPE